MNLFSKSFMALFVVCGLFVPHNQAHASKDEEEKREQATQTSFPVLEGVDQETQTPASFLAMEVLHEPSLLNLEPKGAVLKSAGNVPFEIWLEVLSFLDPKSLLNQRLISKNFNNLALNPHFWQDTEFSITEAVPEVLPPYVLNLKVTYSGQWPAHLIYGSDDDRNCHLESRKARRFKDYGTLAKFHKKLRSFVVENGLCPSPFSDALGIGNESAKAVSVFPKLQTLSIALENIDHEGASYLSSLVNLGNLNLEYNNLGVGGAKHISLLKNLHTLNIGGNMIMDEGAGYISSLTDLQTLKIGMNQIGNQGVKYLSSLKNLLILGIDRNNIGNEGAEHLSSLSSLTALDIAYNDIGHAGKKVLQEKLPHTNIQFEEF
jgi:hypothetical protein